MLSLKLIVGIDMLLVNLKRRMNKLRMCVDNMTLTNLPLAIDSADSAYLKLQADYFATELRVIDIIFLFKHGQSLWMI